MSLKNVDEFLHNLFFQFDKNNNFNLEGTFKQTKIVLPEEMIEDSLNAYTTCYPKGEFELFFSQIRLF